MAYGSPEKQREYRKRWTAANQAKVREAAKRRFQEKKSEIYRGRSLKRAERRIEIRAILDKTKSTPCQDCGNCFPTVCMDFDHRPGEEKLFVLGSCTWLIPSLEELHAEIAKCDVVCSNCHRLRTFKRKAQKL
jgi:hypothetical protein